MSANGKRWIISIFALICSFLFVSPLGAQRRVVDNVPEGPIRFFLDTVNFYHPDSQNGQMVIFYKVAYDHLQFVKEEDGYRATFHVVCVVYDKGDRQVAGDVVSSGQWVKTYDETNSNEEFIQGQFQFFLPAGEYQIRVWIEGQYGNELVSAQNRTSLRFFSGASLSLSDLLLATEIWPQGILEGGYERNGLFFMPSVEHSFSDVMPLLSCYFEIYDREAERRSGSPYEIKFEVINSSGEVVTSDSSRVVRQGPMSLGQEVLQVGTWDEDQYLLRLTVEDSEDGRTVQGQTDFVVRWSTMGHMAKDYEEAVEQLRYIATDAEYKELKSAQGERRKDVWLKFWEDRDPTPGTPANEMKVEYYRRIEYANVQFSVVSPGWKTDRGRIYIIYGPPDDIERHPMDIGLKPYQIWHYYSSNRLFYFVDEDGYGDYKLVAWR